jgi:hypothetical protein
LDSTRKYAPRGSGRKADNRTVTENIARIASELAATHGSGGLKGIAGRLSGAAPGAHRGALQNSAGTLRAVHCAAGATHLSIEFAVGEIDLLDVFLEVCVGEAGVRLEQLPQGRNDQPHPFVTVLEVSQVLPGLGQPTVGIGLERSELVDPALLVNVEQIEEIDHGLLRLRHQPPILRMTDMAVSYSIFEMLLII